MAAKEGTTVEQEGVSHDNDSAEVAMRQATNQPPISHERLRGIYVEREKSKPQDGMFAVVKE